MHRLSRRRFAGFSVLAALALGSCGDAPTSSAGCNVAEFGPAFSFVVPNAAALQPALLDARDRLLPNIPSGAQVLPAAVQDLGFRLGGTDRVAACRAFNHAVESFFAVDVSAPAESGPEVEAVRLALRLTYTYLVSN